jgi:adenylosuccinate lyase
LIERYSPPRIREIWSDRHRFELWLRVEILACEGWATIGRIPAAALPRLRAATFDPDRVRALEATVGHDVIAFLTVVNESIGQPEARYVHLGMTSQDLNDTAMAVQIVESAQLIGHEVAKVREAAADLAIKHRRTLMAGRTHGIVAEPTTFGFKVAGWVAELDRSIERLQRAADEAAHSDRVFERDRGIGELRDVGPRVRGDQLARRHLVFRRVHGVDGDELAAAEITGTEAARGGRAAQDHGVVAV